MAIGHASLFFLDIDVLPLLDIDVLCIIKGNEHYQQEIQDSKF